MQAVRSRQRAAFTTHNSWQSETRWLSLYCCDPDLTTYDLISNLNVRREQLRAMFRHYGLDYGQRNHAHAHAIQAQEQTAHERYDHHVRTCEMCRGGICYYARTMKRRAEQAERRAR